MERLYSRKMPSKNIKHFILQFLREKNNTAAQAQAASFLGTTADTVQLVVYLNHWILKRRPGLRLARFPVCQRFPLLLQANSFNLCVLQLCKQSEKLRFSCSSSVLPQLRAKSLSLSSVTESKAVKKVSWNLWYEGICHISSNATTINECV